MLELTCTSYRAGGNIPLRYAHRSVRGGSNISPGFRWTDPPEGTACFLLAVVDPHPVARDWIHWLVADIPAGSGELPEDASGSSRMPKGSVESLNSFGEKGYGGPAPPAGTGPHPYVATLFALSGKLYLPGGRMQWGDVLRAAKTLELVRATVTGYYERKEG